MPWQAVKGDEALESRLYAGQLALSRATPVSQRASLAAHTAAFMPKVPRYTAEVNVESP